MKFRKSTVVNFAIGGLLLVSLFANAVQYIDKDGLTSEQMKQVARGDFIKTCLELSENNDSDCGSIKVGEPEWYSGIDGSVWIVDSSCFSRTGEGLDCTTHQPTD